MADKNENGKTEWVFSMCDTSCTEARYAVWSNIYTTEDKARAAMKKQFDSDVEAGAVDPKNVTIRNGGREISDNAGRMFYKIMPRVPDRTE